MLYTNILFSYFNLCFSHIPNSFNFDANIYMLGFHYIVLIFILIVYIICFSFFVNPPALAQPIIQSSFPPAPFFVPSRTRTVCYSVFLPFLPSRTCTKLERGFEARSAIVDQLPEVGARVWSTVCNRSPEKL